jgi:hypothetical protein
LTIVLQIYLHVGHAVSFVHWHILQLSHSSGQQLKQAMYQGALPVGTAELLTVSLYC